MKILNVILIIIICILLSMSILALVALHWNLAELSFDISPEGFELYLTSYGQFQALFTGTIAVCAAYFGLLRVKVSVDANLEKIKQDYFTEWKTVIQVRAAEVEKADKFMMREIVKIRLALFNDLYDLNFSITNKNKLIEIFNKHIKTRVRLFEETNEKQVGMGAAYPDEGHSYSYDTFRFIFLGMIDSGYENLEIDLKELYLDNMDGNRCIDLENYQRALRIF